jgi:hypothetical protein
MLTLALVMLVLAMLMVVERERAVDRVVIPSSVA